MKYSESQALAKAAAYCSKSERSEFDVKRKLQNWEVTEDTTQKIITHLKNENYLNEKRFCRAFIKDKVRFNKWGKTKIVFELKKKQLSNNVIDSCFSEFNLNEFDKQLVGILRTKIKSIKAQNDYEKRTKLIRFALSRGFSYEQTLQTLHTILKETDEDDFS